jgi:hypothetical protein
MRRDTTYRRRLTGGFVASLVFHALLAAILFTLSSSSSEQASSESVSGGEVVSVTRQAIPVPARKQPSVAKPVPVPVRAQPKPMKPRPVVLPHPRVLHELSKQAPTAPPNPTPQPVHTPVPQAPPTEAPLKTTNEPVIAQPTAVPTMAPVAVAVKAPPTEAPKPIATAAPSIAPKPVATAAPTTAPTSNPLVAAATPAPLATANVPAPRVALPRPSPGVPSPGPSPAKQPSTTKGTAPSPGPKTSASPGTRGLTKNPPASAPPRPVQAPPTPAPESTPKPRPAAKATKEPPDINARLRSLIPTGPVAGPQSKQYSGKIGDIGKNLAPTPPPEILARTKFTAEHKPGGEKWKWWPLSGAAEEAYVKFYVTDVRDEGGVRVCHGWVARYPIVASSSYNGITLNPSDPSRYPGRLSQPKTKWIVEPDVTFACPKDMTPFTPPSPNP